MREAKLAIATLCLVIPFAAHADLITDEIYGCASNPGVGCVVAGTGFNWFENNSGAGAFAGMNSGDTATVADPGVEFFGGGGGGDFLYGFSADFGSDSLTIQLDFSFTRSAGFVNQEWFFAGLDWVGSPDGHITGLTLLDGNTLAINSFSFTDDSIRITQPGLAIEPGERQLQATFLIGTSHAAVPEPGTLALVGIGLFGIGLARRRKTA